MKKEGFFFGWKEIANYIGVHYQSVRRWHFKRLALPFIKSTPARKKHDRGRIMVTQDIVDAWVERLSKIHDHRSKYWLAKKTKAKFKSM